MSLQNEKKVLPPITSRGVVTPGKHTGEHTKNTDFDIVLDWFQCTLKPHSSLISSFLINTLFYASGPFLPP